MTKAFSEREKQQIRTQLIQCAGQLIASKGMKSITVEEIAIKCKIAKGSFYNFFSSKELLFWEVIMQWNDEINEEFGQMAEECENISVESLTNVIVACYMRCYQIGLGPILLNGELEYLIRKLPEELIQDHMLNGDELLYEVIMRIPGMDAEKTRKYALAFQSIFVLLMYRDKIGDDFEEVLQLTIRGIVMQMVGGDKQ